jgi:hypothetical protein
MNPRNAPRKDKSLAFRKVSLLFWELLSFIAVIQGRY